MINDEAIRLMKERGTYLVPTVALQETMDRNAEIDCILRFKRGDESAFNDLFIAYHRSTLAIALRFTRNEELALDIAQEVSDVAAQATRTIL